MPALAGYNGAILLTSTPSVALASNFALQDSGDHTTFVVSTANTAYRYWDRSSSFTFQTSGDGSTGWTTVTPASVRYVNGQVTFASAVSGASPSARITAGNYFPYAVLAQVSEWNFDGEWNMEDVTVLSGGASGGGGSRATLFLPTMFKGTFKIKKFWVDESALSVVTYITAGTPLILSCVTPDGHRYEAYVYDAKGSIANSVSKAVSEDLEFQIDGPPTFI